MPTWTNTGANPNARVTNAGRTVHITDGGIAPEAGAAAYGACDADVAFPSGAKVAICIQHHVVDDADGTTAITNRCGRFGVVNGDFASLGATTSAATLGNSADSWAVKGNADPSDILAEGATVFSSAIAIGDSEYTVLLVDVDAGKAWLANAVGGSPGTLTVVSSGDPAAGTTPTWTLDTAGLKVAFSSAGDSLRIVGATILTAAEFTALNITLPTGFAYVTDGTPVPTSLAVEQGTGKQLSVEWDAGSGDSIEIEVSATEGGFTGTPTATGITDDGGPALLSVASYGTWWVKIRRVTDSVASDWSSAVSASVTSGATLVLAVKNSATKIAPCGIVASIVDSTPPTGQRMERTTAHWRWYLDDVLQDSHADRLSSGWHTLVSGEVKVEVFWYDDDGTALGTDSATFDVAAESTYDVVRYLSTEFGDDGNDGLTVETPKATLTSIAAGIDWSADHERKIVFAGARGSITPEPGFAVSLGTPNGSLIVEANGVSLGACIAYTQHTSASDPSPHLRLAMIDMSVDQAENDSYGALKITLNTGSDESRARGLDVLWTGDHAIGDNVGTTGILIVKNQYVGTSDDWTGPTMDWPGHGDIVVRLGEVSGFAPQWYGELEYGSLQVDEWGAGENHVVRIPRFKAAVVEPKDAARAVFRQPGTTGDYAMKLYGRAKTSTGNLAERLDGHGIDIIDCNFEAQDGGGTSVAMVSFGPVNDADRSFCSIGRVVRPKHVVAEGSTAAAGRNLVFVYAGARGVAIYDPIIEHPYSSIVRLANERFAVVSDYPADTSLLTHEVTIYRGSQRKIDDGGAIIRHGGAGDVSGHTWRLKLRDIAAACGGVAGSSAIQVLSTPATMEIDAEGIVTDADDFAEVDGSPVSLATFVSAFGAGTGCAEATDPDFADAAGGDFSVDSGSPLWEAGGGLGLPVDHEGTARSSPTDIGAIESSPSGDGGLTAPTSLAGAQVSRTAVVTITYDTAPEGATGIQARHRYGSAVWSAWADLGTPDGSSDMTAAEVQTGTLSVESRFTGDGVDPSPAAAASVAMLEPAPSAPAAPSLAQVGPSTVARVTIATVARADDGYLVERSTTGAFGGEETEVGTLEPGDLTIDDDVGAYSEERWYRVTALNATLGDSSPGTAASITLVAPELDAPTDLAVVPGGLTGSATWSDNSSGVAAYVLWRRQEGDVEWDLATAEETDPGAESAAITVPSAGAWEIAVAIVDDLDQSNWSIVSVTFVDLPAPPERVAVGASAIGGRAFLVQWELPESEIPYVYALVEWTGSIDGSPIDGGAWQYGGTTLASILAYLVVVPENATNVLPRVTLLRLVDGNRLVAGEPTEADAAYGSPIPEVLP